MHDPKVQNYPFVCCPQNFLQVEFMLLDRLNLRRIGLGLPPLPQVFSLTSCYEAVIHDGGSLDSEGTGLTKRDAYTEKLRVDICGAFQFS